MFQFPPVAWSQSFSPLLKGLGNECLKVGGRIARSAALALAALLGSIGAAEAEDRTLKLYFTHTGERATITYKRDGRFDRKAMAQINHILRDWRRNQSTNMDPRLIDLVWDIYQRSGSSNYIHVVSGYRSPATNNMLRGRSRATGVAKQSQHMLGKAMDFFIPGVKLSSLRAYAMQAQGGGVGYYPTSGSPFVHVDVASVRAWPRMSRQELVRLFPNGRTIHVPADGRPLPGYAVALAEYKRRGGGASSSYAIARATPREEEADDDMPTPSLPERRAVVTAMLPVPKNRPEEAFEMLTGSRDNATGNRPPEANRGFVDLASLAAVPAPAFRPSPTSAIDPVETASIDPALTKRTAAGLSGESGLPAPIPGIKPGLAAAPAIPAAFVPGLAFGGSGKTLKSPTTGSIADLPITGPDLDPEDEFDAEDTLIAWAVSAPGTPAGMTAPVMIGRTLTDLTTAPERTDPLPAGITEEFDHDRFWGKS